MLTTPMDVLSQSPVRKTKKQKATFRKAVCAYAESLGYTVTIEKGSFGAQNVILGDPEGASYLITAHYDTCARMMIPNFITPCNLLPYICYQILLALVLLLTALCGGLFIGYFWRGMGLKLTLWIYWALLICMIVGPANQHNANDNTSGVVTLLEIARTLPENQRRKVCFVLFDLEEAGLIGSASYRKNHKTATNRQLVLNLDCVGDGDKILLFPSKKLKKDSQRLTLLQNICGCVGKKCITLRKKGFSFYPSDQANFPYGVGVCALRKGLLGLYIGKIHTNRDRVLELTNVNLLRAALISLISGGGTQ